MMPALVEFMPTFAIVISESGKIVQPPSDKKRTTFLTLIPASGQSPPLQLQSAHRPSLGPPAAALLLYGCGRAGSVTAVTLDFSSQEQRTLDLGTGYRRRWVFLEGPQDCQRPHPRRLQTCPISRSGSITVPWAGLAKNHRQ